MGNVPSYFKNLAMIQNKLLGILFTLRIRYQSFHLYLVVLLLLLL